MASRTSNPGSEIRPTASWRPWQWCNLGRNPFGELTREDRVSVAECDVQAIASRVSADRQAVQLIGDCGRGKTTRMLRLSDMIMDSVYVYLPEDQPCPVIPWGRPLLIDEAQRLPRRVRGEIFASGLPLVLATHRDLKRPLRAAGYTFHNEHIGDANDAELLCRIANRRLELCRLGPGQVPVLSIEDARWLVKKFGSDFRAVEGFLYEQIQSQKNSHGQMRFIDPVR